MRPLVIAIHALLVVCAGSVLAGCGTATSVSSAEGDGPKLMSTSPRAGGELAANRRTIKLRFDDVLDTGAQVLVQYGDADVIAGEPEFTDDRRGLDAVIDAEDRGKYEVSWRVCSATRKTACSKGTFGFEAPGSS